MVAGIDGVPAVGHRRRRRPRASAASRRLLPVELPLALPVIVAGIRVATVTTVGLVAITGDHPARRPRPAHLRRLRHAVLHEDRGGLGGCRSASPWRSTSASTASRCVLTPWARRRAPRDRRRLLAQSGEPSNVIEWFTGPRRPRRARARSPSRCGSRSGTPPPRSPIVVVVAVPLAIVLAHHRKGELAAAAGHQRRPGHPHRHHPRHARHRLARATATASSPGRSCIALVLLGLPPAVHQHLRRRCGAPTPAPSSAARAMGFTEREVMLRVELPLAVPVIIAGVRIAAVQIVATEPLAAFFGADGLGAYLAPGLGNRDFVPGAGRCPPRGRRGHRHRLPAVPPGAPCCRRALRHSARRSCPRRAAAPSASTTHHPDKGTNRWTTRWRVLLARSSWPSASPPPRAARQERRRSGSDSGSGSGTTPATDDHHPDRPPGLRREQDPHRGLRPVPRGQGLRRRGAAASGFRDQVYPALEDDKARHDHRLHRQRRPLPRPETATPSPTRGDLHAR